MARKLSLVGLLMLVDRGGVGQLAIAIIIAFGFLSTHLLSWPYKRPSDNLLRASTEAHVFLAVMLALVLKNDLQYENISAEVYENIMFWSFIIMVPVAFVLAVRAKLIELIPVPTPCMCSATSPSSVQLHFIFGCNDSMFHGVQDSV